MIAGMASSMAAGGMSNKVDNYFNLSGNFPKSNLELKTDSVNSYKETSFSDRGIEIPKHIKEYLNNLKKKDDFIVVDLKSFTEADVSVMSKETGVEFVKITVVEKTYLVRGNSGGTSIPNSILDEMAKNGGTLDFHTHPYNNDLIPSPADRQVLAKLEEMTGQCESKIVTPDNQVALFDKNGAKSITNVEHTIAVLPFVPEYPMDLILVSVRSHSASI